VLTLPLAQVFCAQWQGNLVALKQFANSLNLNIGFKGEHPNIASGIDMIVHNSVVYRGECVLRVVEHVAD
jgi:hypothetical protein